MSDCPSVFDSNKISRPSGDQRGAIVSAPKEVSWTAFDPSGSASHISESPERVDWKATRRPSGENWAILSIRVEEIAATGGDEAGAPGAEVSIRQMFQSLKLRA